MGWPAAYIWRRRIRAWSSGWSRSRSAISGGGVTGPTSTRSTAGARPSCFISTS
jgi:hypothetical protein